MGPTWVLSAPGRPHVVPMHLAVRVACTRPWWPSCEMPRPIRHYTACVGANVLLRSDVWSDDHELNQRKFFVKLISECQTRCWHRPRDICCMCDVRRLLNNRACIYFEFHLSQHNKESSTCHGYVLWQTTKKFGDIIDVIGTCVDVSRHLLKETLMHSLILPKRHLIFGSSANYVMHRFMNWSFCSLMICTRKVE